MYFRPDAIRVLLVDEGQHNILPSKQFRLHAFLNGSDSGYLVETCAGIIDENETSEQTARREVAEETGYQIKELEKIASAYTSAGGITEFVHLFIASYTSEKDQPKTGGLEGEDNQLIEFGYD